MANNESDNSLEWASQAYALLKQKQEEKKQELIKQVSTTDKRGNATVISAMVPLANMFGYINNLRSMSQGRAQYSMFFDHYAKVPQNVQDEVTKKMA